MVKKKIYSIPYIEHEFILYKVKRKFFCIISFLILCIIVLSVSNGFWIYYNNQAVTKNDNVSFINSESDTRTVNMSTNNYSDKKKKFVGQVFCYGES